MTTTGTVDRANHLLAVGRAHEALSLLSADDETPSDGEALVTVARCHYRLGDHRAALEAAGAATSVDPDLAGGWLMIALGQRAVDRIGDGVQAPIGVRMAQQRLVMGDRNTA